MDDRCLENKQRQKIRLKHYDKQTNGQTIQ